MENLNQIFENNHQLGDDYLTYITRRSEQQERTYSLDSVVENINMVGMVAAMTARESMASHNSIFKMLYAINEAQGALMNLVIDLRLNNGGGGGGINGTTALGIASALDAPMSTRIATIIIGGLFGSKLDGSEEARQAELNHPNSLTNKALRAQGDAHQLIRHNKLQRQSRAQSRSKRPGCFYGW